MTEVVQAVIPYAMSHFALCRLEAPVFDRVVYALVDRAGG